MKSNTTVRANYYVDKATGKKYLRNPADALQLAIPADWDAAPRAGKRAAVGMDSAAVDKERAAENARRMAGIDRAALDRSARYLTTPAGEESGDAVTCGHITPTAVETTPEERAAHIDNWLRESGAGSGVLPFAVAAVNSKSRKMVKYGSPVYFRNRAEMLDYMADVRTVQRPRRMPDMPELWTYAGPAREVVRLRKPLRAVWAPEMVNCVSYDAGAGSASIMADAVQEVAADVCDRIRDAVMPADIAAHNGAFWANVAADMAGGHIGNPEVLTDAAAMNEITLNRLPAAEWAAVWNDAARRVPLDSAAWLDAMRKTDAWLRYNGRREYGKDATESLKAEQKRGRAKGYTAKTFRVRADVEGALLDAEIVRFRGGINACMGYDVAAHVDAAGALIAIQQYAAHAGGNTPAVLEYLLRGTSVNDTAAALGVNRKTVSRHKSKLMDIAVQYIRAAAPEYTPRRNRYALRVTLETERRGGRAVRRSMTDSRFVGSGQQYYGGHFPPLRLSSFAGSGMHAGAHAPRLRIDTARVHVDVCRPTFAAVPDAVPAFDEITRRAAVVPVICRDSAGRNHTVYGRRAADTAAEKKVFSRYAAGTLGAVTVREFYGREETRREFMGAVESYERRANCRAAVERAVRDTMRLHALTVETLMDAAAMNEITAF